MKRPHFALPEIYDDSLSYYDVLRKLIKSMHAIVDNLNKIPEQIANEAKARLLGDQNLQANIENEAQAREQADQEIREGVSNKISELKGDIADVNNTTETPAGAGKVWTSTESGAGWREPTGGKAGSFELLVSQELAETVNAVSFEFGKKVNEIYMMCESPKIIATSPCTWVNENGQQIGFWPSSLLSASTKRYVMSHFYKIDNVKVVCDTRYGANDISLNNINTSYHKYFNDGISKLSAKYANGLVAGTKFTIWGRLQ